MPSDRVQRSAAGACSARAPTRAGTSFSREQVVCAAAPAPPRRGASSSRRSTARSCSISSIASRRIRRRRPDEARAGRAAARLSAGRRRARRPVLARPTRWRTTTARAAGLHHLDARERHVDARDSPRRRPAAAAALISDVLRLQQQYRRLPWRSRGVLVEQQRILARLLRKHPLRARPGTKTTSNDAAAELRGRGHEHAAVSPRGGSTRCCRQPIGEHPPHRSDRASPVRRRPSGRGDRRARAARARGRRSTRGRQPLEPLEPLGHAARTGQAASALDDRQRERCRWPSCSMSRCRCIERGRFGVFLRLLRTS